LEGIRGHRRRTRFPQRVWGDARQNGHDSNFRRRGKTGGECLIVVRDGARRTGAGGGSLGASEAAGDGELRDDGPGLNLIREGGK
jgi:hypothetical protein